VVDFTRRLLAPKRGDLELIRMLHGTDDGP
jgi:hypothetical protein